MIIRVEGTGGREAAWAVLDFQGKVVRTDDTPLDGNCIGELTESPEVCPAVAVLDFNPWGLLSIKGFRRAEGPFGTGNQFANPKRFNSRRLGLAGASASMPAHLKTRCCRKELRQLRYCPRIGRVVPVGPCRCLLVASVGRSIAFVSRPLTLVTPETGRITLRASIDAVATVQRRAGAYASIGYCSR